MEKIENMKKFEKKCEKSLKIQKNVIKKNTAFVKKSYDALTNISIINKFIYNNQTHLCKQFKDVLIYNCNLIFNKAFPITVAASLPFGFGPLVILFIKEIFTNLTICDLIRKLSCPADLNFRANLLESKYLFKSVLHEFKTNVSEKWNDEIDKKVDPLIEQFKFNYTYDKNALSKIDADKSYKKIGLEIALIYKERFEYVSAHVYKLKFIFPISFIFLVWSAILYQNKYLKRDHFQNYVIGVKFYELDAKRRSKGQHTILPLNSLLKTRYVELFDLSLTKIERHYTVKSLGTLIIFVLPILLAMLIETSLISINQYIVENSEIDIEYKQSENFELKPHGSGALARAYKELFGFFQDKDNEQFTFKNKKCMQEPSPANLDTHQTIKTSVLILVVLTCLQAYIKRLRSVFAGCVHPDRDQERSLWLYNHLLAVYSKMGFLVNKNRKGGSQSSLNKQDSNRENIKKVSMFIVNIFYTIFMYLSFYYCFGLVERINLESLIQKYKLKFLPLYLKLSPPKRKYCIGCSSDLDDDLNDDNFTKCENKLCSAYYCIGCFIQLNNSCKMCKTVINSDACLDNESIENDSSDDDQFLNNESLCTLNNKDLDILSNDYKNESPRSSEFNELKGSNEPQEQVDAKKYFLRRNQKVR